MAAFFTFVLPLGLLLAGPSRCSRRFEAGQEAGRTCSPKMCSDFVSKAAAKALPSVALIFTESCDTSHGSACVIETAGTETMLLTTSSVTSRGALEVAFADDFSVRHSAKVVGSVDDLNLVLLQLLATDVPKPCGLTFGGDDATLSDGDFVIALGNPQGPRGGASLGLLVGRSATSMSGSDAPEVTPGTAEAAMAEAEAEAEAEALERGELPFLVTDAALVDGASGGPLLDAAGAVVGIHTLVISAGEGSTRYYAVSATRTARAVETMLERRRALGEAVDGVRVVLLNDGVNKRERVAAVLAAAGLSEQAASFAMLSAHKTGRGVLGFFETVAEAEALQQNLIAIDKRSQEMWLATDEPGAGPAARWAQDLLLQTEPCKLFRKEQGGAEGMYPSQLEA